MKISSEHVGRILGAELRSKDATGKADKAASRPDQVTLSRTRQRPADRPARPGQRAGGAGRQGRRAPPAGGARRLPRGQQRAGRRRTARTREVVSDDSDSPLPPPPLAGAGDPACPFRPGEASGSRPGRRRHRGHRRSRRAEDGVAPARVSPLPQPRQPRPERGRRGGRCSPSFPPSSKPPGRPSSPR